MNRLLNDGKRILIVGIAMFVIAGILFLVGQTTFSRELDDLRASFGLVGGESSFNPSQMAFQQHRSRFYLPGERMSNNSLPFLGLGVVMIIGGVVSMKKKAQKDLLEDMQKGSTDN